jgi:hypothetical protein
MPSDAASPTRDGWDSESSQATVDRMPAEEGRIAPRNGTRLASDSLLRFGPAEGRVQNPPPPFPPGEPGVAPLLKADTAERRRESPTRYVRSGDKNNVEFSKPLDPWDAGSADSSHACEAVASSYSDKQAVRSQNCLPGFGSAAKTTTRLKNQCHIPSGNPYQLHNLF